MASQTKSYFLAPNWDLQKDGPLALGDILIDPTDPVFSKLSSFTTSTTTTTTNTTTNTTTATTTLPLPYIYTNRAERWSHKIDTKNNISSNIFAHFLEGLGIGVGADFSVSSNLSRGRSYTMDSIQTSYFVPEPAYVRARLQDPNVTLYLSSLNRFRSRSLYIITGVKTAKGLVVRTTKGRGWGVSGQVQVDLTPIGVPVSLGGGGTWERGREVESSLEKEGDVEVVFAYQLRKIRLKGSGSVDNWPVNKGAFMGRDDKGGGAIVDVGLDFGVGGVVSDVKGGFELEIGSSDVGFEDLVQHQQENKGDGDAKKDFLRKLDKRILVVEDENDDDECFLILG